MKNEQLLKHLSIVTLAIMFLSFGTVLSANAQFSGSGSGTSTSDPYQITTDVQLNEVRNNLSAHYKLMNDVDLSSWISTNSPTTGWTPIGNSTTPFSGTFDGNGHVISGLWINWPTTDIVGLFGYLYSASASDIEIKDLGVLIASQGIIGQNHVGGIVGYIGYSGTIFPNVNIHSVFVQGNVTGADNVGAIVGRSIGNLRVANAYAGGGTITATATTGRAGGLVGIAERNTMTTITNCYATNTIVAGTGSTLAAGIIASIGGSASIVEGSPGAYANIAYNVAINAGITGRDNTSSIGRVAGWFQSTDKLTISLTNYAFEGTLVNGAVPATTGLAHKNGLSKTISEVTSSETYTAIFGWDFDDVWQMGNGSYQLPVLKSITLNKQPSAALSHLGSGSATNSPAINPKAKIYYDKSRETIVVGSESGKPAYIYDAYGRLLLASAQNEINISSLPNGFYVVNTQNSSIKIIK